MGAGLLPVRRFVRGRAGKHQYDLYYIKNQSPMLDALILLETVRIVLFGRFSR